MTTSPTPRTTEHSHASTGDGAPPPARGGRLRLVGGQPGNRPEDRGPATPTDPPAWDSSAPGVAVVHDYLTQRGGAERVVLSLLDAFPEAQVHTALFHPSSTFPEFADAPIHASPLNRVDGLRRRHRLALPLLASTFSTMTVDAPVAICSSSGWAHGIRTTGRKVVYCYTPARWLYQRSTYLGEHPGRAARLSLAGLTPALRRWDQRAAATADRYLTTSTEVRRRIIDEYRVDAEVLPPPPSLSPTDPRQPVEGLEPGYWLCVSRLLPYKNVGAILAAFDQIPNERLVVVGTGPDGARLRLSAGDNVTMLGRVSDAELCWLYANSQGLVAASREDFGLTPLEAAVFGRPSVVLCWGGFVDTVVEGVNGLFFDQPSPYAIKRAVLNAVGMDWDEDKIQQHAAVFSQERFRYRLREIALEEAGAVTGPARPA